jgi:hypothetical protein
MKLLGGLCLLISFLSADPKIFLEGKSQLRVFGDDREVRNWTEFYHDREADMKDYVYIMDLEKEVGHFEGEISKVTIQKFEYPSSQKKNLRWEIAAAGGYPKFRWGFVSIEVPGCCSAPNTYFLYSKSSGKYVAQINHEEIDLYEPGIGRYFCGYTGRFFVSAIDSLEANRPNFTGVVYCFDSAHVISKMLVPKMDPDELTPTVERIDNGLCIHFANDSVLFYQAVKGKISRVNSATQWGRPVSK